MKQIVLCLIYSFTIFSQDTKRELDKKFQEEKERELLDYSNIRSVLKSDGLGKELVKKEKKIVQLKEEKKVIEKKRYSLPRLNQTKSFFSKLWLVKNAPDLNWDKSRPDYGIDKKFSNFLSDLGLINRQIKILIVDSPEVTHMGLPSESGEYIFILSLAFMKILDLSLEDISLLLLEDMLRIDEGYFSKNVGLEEKLSKQYSTKKELSTLGKDILSEYSRVIYNDGFDFSQQYKLTKKMDRLLKSHPKHWSLYIRLLNKLAKLVKTDSLYKKYTRVFPSPELQIKWLSPKKKVL